jgi:hypothetical protein
MRGGTAITVVACCCLDLGSVAATALPAGWDPVAEALRFFEALIVGNDGTRILQDLRPSPIPETDRVVALASVPIESVLVPDAAERAKLKALEAVLMYHERQQIIEIKLIDVPMAVVGLHQRSVILISRPALRLLSDLELQATVAHEMGHEYFWREDVVLRARADRLALQVLELKCDGVAVLTLVALRLSPDHLQRAIEKIALFNGVPKPRWANNGYPSPGDRKRFSRALLNVIQTSDSAYKMRRH